MSTNQTSDLSSAAFDSPSREQREEMLFPLCLVRGLEGELARQLVDLSAELTLTAGRRVVDGAAVLEDPEAPVS